MTMRAVEAAFFWRYGTAAAKAVYGRLSGSEYSKDFLQSPSGQFPLIDRVLGRTGNATIELRHRWPGGTTEGEWRKSAADERGQLSWKPMSASPRPWRMGDPATDPAITIPGDPSQNTEQNANAALAQLAARNLDPWIVAVKLLDETGLLHSRAYLGKPPAGSEKRSLASLPTKLRQAIAALPANAGGGAVEFSKPGTFRNRAPALLQRIKDSLARDPNVLLVGPPGTGKTVVLEDLREQFLSEAGTVYFDPDRWEDAWSEVQKSRKALSVVFHPSYGYEDFVAGLLPSMEAGGFRLTARPGPLLSLAHWANASKNREALLIIDEFNRGTTAAIFGDTIALLDRDKRSDLVNGYKGASIVRPYPREEMKVDDAYKDEKTSTDVATDLTLPLSLQIVAALNSSDRSVAPLDAALRRRFAIIFVPPDYEILARHLGVTNLAGIEVFTPSSTDPNNWSIQDAKCLVVSLLRSLNQRIEFLLSSDMLLGHALLWSVGGDTVEQIGVTLAQAFDERIASALRLTFVDQDESLAAILRAGLPDSAASPSAAAGLARWIFPEGDMQAVASPRLEILPQVDRPPFDILRTLLGIL